MILDILASLKETTIADSAEHDSDKDVQRGDEVVVGILSGQALSLFVYIRVQMKVLTGMKADVLVARAKAIRSQAEEDINTANKLIIDFYRLGTRLNKLNHLLRFEVAEEFNVEPNWCVGFRKGFRAVKYAGPPADRGMTIIEIVGGID